MPVAPSRSAPAVTLEEASAAPVGCAAGPVPLAVPRPRLSSVCVICNVCVSSQFEQENQRLVGEMNSLCDEVRCGVVPVWARGPGAASPGPRAPSTHSAAPVPTRGSRATRSPQALGGHRTHRLPQLWVCCLSGETGALRGTAGQGWLPPAGAALGLSPSPPVSRSTERGPPEPPAARSPGGVWPPERKAWNPRCGESTSQQKRVLGAAPTLPWGQSAGPPPWPSSRVLPGPPASPSGAAALPPRSSGQDSCPQLPAWAGHCPQPPAACRLSPLMPGQRLTVAPTPAAPHLGGSADLRCEVCKQHQRQFLFQHRVGSRGRCSLSTNLLSRKGWGVVLSQGFLWTPP